MSRFGYACLNVTLGPKMGGFRSMIKRTWQQKGLPYASSLMMDNVKILAGIINWNVKNDIQVYRMTSTLAPWCSEYEFEQLPDWKKISGALEKIGNFALANNQRLSFHPGQFNCLGSPKDNVINNCIKDLRSHGEIMDAMNLPRTHQSKINIHIGGTYGDKQAAMDRWCKNFEKLPESVKSRLTIENDDKATGFSVIDLHKVWQRLGTPIVFDYHHHTFCTGDLSIEDALKLAASTWPTGIKPVTHYSESAADREGKSVTRTAHSAFVTGPINDYGIDIDCVIEAKAKELAVLQLRTGRSYEHLFSDKSNSGEE